MKDIILLILLPLFGGCASVGSSVSDGHPNRDWIPVEPGSRAVMMTGTYYDADRDGWLWLPRGAGPFQRNNGVVVKDDVTVGFITSEPNLFLIGNVLYGGIPGVFVDVLGGGAWELHSRPIPKSLK